MRQMIGVLGVDGLVSVGGEVIARPAAAPVPAPAVVQPSAVEVVPYRQRRNDVAVLDRVDEITALFARALKLTVTLSREDQQRVRNIMEATRSTLYATTYLDRPDQAKFEQALRNAARET
ncbi:hypothetical protein [Bradyrhizobium sp. McL0615]|uniref:hypothetical protein n=1 Tax=Bradyrhizobium sp. McL0615 TaxID=3415673 RepID=UPI003CEB4ED7